MNGDISRFFGDRWKTLMPDEKNKLIRYWQFLEQGAHFNQQAFQEQCDELVRMCWGDLSDADLVKFLNEELHLIDELKKQPRTRLKFNAP